MSIVFRREGTTVPTADVFGFCSPGFLATECVTWTVRTGTAVTSATPEGSPP